MEFFNITYFSSEKIPVHQRETSSRDLLMGAEWKKLEKEKKQHFFS